MHLSLFLFIFLSYLLVFKIFNIPPKLVNASPMGSSQPEWGSWRDIGKTNFFFAFLTMIPEQAETIFPNKLGMDIVLVLDGESIRVG